MLLPLMLTMLLSGTDAPPAAGPSDDCVRKLTCRYVGIITARTKDGGAKVVPLNRNEPFLVGDKGGEPLRLMVGEMVVLRVGHAGEPPLVVLRSGPASDLPKARVYEALESNIRQSPIPDGPVQGHEMTLTNNSHDAVPTTAPPPPDTIRLTLKQLDGTDMTVLIIDNGYGRMLEYNAQIFGKATDVCQVRAGMPVMENWPYPILAIELSNFHFVEPDPSGHPLCR